MFIIMDPEWKAAESQLFIPRFSNFCFMEWFIIKTVPTIIYSSDKKQRDEIL